MPPSDSYKNLLYRYACFYAGAILFLICMGGVVTSEDAGMSVPDYPTSFGYNMFLFPWKEMTGGIFWEHSHRLIGTGVGVLSIILAVWLSFQNRVWMRWLGWIALGVVILQGLIGGLRVLYAADWIIIPHAMTSQAFFGLAALIALFTSRWWLDPTTVRGVNLPPRFTRWALVVTCLIYLQLILGVTMRFQHTDLSVTDFPAAYGQAWPMVDPVSVAEYNKERLAKNLHTTTAVQISIQMTHRLMAVIVTTAILATVFRLAWCVGVSPALLRTSLVWLGLVLAQFTLGMCVIWTNKAADVATAHVAIGDLTFITGIILTAKAWRLENAMALSTSFIAAKEKPQTPQLQPTA